MVTPDVGEAAVEAAAQSMPYQVEDRYEVAREALAAAAPHLRADERARVLAEVQTALLDDGAWRAWYRAKNPDRSWALGDEFPRFVTPQERATLADYLRDTVGAGGEG